jgi:outer membrane protein assembly factor BamB
VLPAGLALLLAAALLPAADRAGGAPPAPAEWPTFHGNLLRTGAADAQPGPERAKLRWKFRDPEGRAGFFSSPALAGGRLYLGAENGTLYCLDTETGQPAWRAQADWEVFSSPAVAGGRVYVGEGLHSRSGTSRFRCFDAQSGVPLWQVTVNGHIESSPAVADGRVYFGAGPAGLYCLDAADGHQLWRLTARHIDASPAVAGGRVYAGASGPAAMLCLDAASGKKLWETPCAYPPAGAPALQGNRLWFGTGNGTIEGSAAHPAGAVLCLETQRGRVLWNVPLPDAVTGSVALAGSVAVLGARDGRAYAFDAARGIRKWAVKIGAPVTGTPVAGTGGRLFFAADDAQLRCLAAADGQVLWTYGIQNFAPRSASPRIASSPALAGGRLYVAGVNGVLVCLENEPAGK